MARKSTSTKKTATAKPSKKQATAPSKKSTKKQGASEAGTKKLTRAQAKGVYKDLPPGGVWRTIRGNHVYIVDGQIVAGVGVGKTGKPIKLAKKELAEHFAALKQANKEKKKATAKKPSAKTTTKKTSDKKPVIEHVVKLDAAKKHKAGTSGKPKYPDYSKMSRQELEAHYGETWRKHEQEAQELYGNKLDELKRKYRELQDKGAEISRQRKSKAREAALEANRREMDANLKEQARIWSEQQEYIRKQKESHPIYAEVRRRNEADDRKRTGDLLPEESAKLRKELGAKEFDPSAPKEKFYRRKGDQWDSRAVTGVPIDLGHGVEGFIYRSDNGSKYTVHIARTGEQIIQHYPNYEQAGEGDEANYRRAANLALVKMHALVHGDDFRSGMGKDVLKKRLAEIEERYGVSPRYNDDGSIKAGMDKSRSGQAPKVYTYHIQDKQGNWSEQTGTKVSVHPDLITFLHKDEASGKYVVTEARTGLSMGYDDTKSGALDKAKNAVANMGIEKVKNLLSQYISKNGESPSWGENLRKALIESERKLLEDWRREGWQR